MKKIGVVFPGQGSQYVGMGKKLYDVDKDVRGLFERADDILGFSLTNLCFNGPEEELRQTYNTQPALLLVAYAVWNFLKKELPITPYLIAGHSLGEYTALLVSGYFTFDDAISITRTRGLLMEQACPKGQGGMVALIGANMDVIEPVLREISRDDYVAVPANINSPEQVVLSGTVNALREAVEKLRGTGYKKAVFLNVSGPFHSPLMRDAAERLKGELDRIPEIDMQIPVVYNVDATPSQEKKAVKEKLYRQMFSPVLWERSIRRMVDEGVEVFLEVGPQKVLTNLIKRIVPAIPCYNVESIEDIGIVKGAVV